MSELRDTAAALRAFDKRLSSIEECLLLLVRNSEQEAEWRHEQRNQAQAQRLREDAIDRSLRQGEEFQGALWKYLARLDETLEALAGTRHEDVRSLSARVRKLEQDAGDEVTQT